MTNKRNFIYYQPLMHMFANINLYIVASSI